MKILGFCRFLMREQLRVLERRRAPRGEINLSLRAS